MKDFIEAAAKIIDPEAFAVEPPEYHALDSRVRSKLAAHAEVQREAARSKALAIFGLLDAVPDEMQIARAVFALAVRSPGKNVSRDHVMAVWRALTSPPETDAAENRLGR